MIEKQYQSLTTIWNNIAIDIEYCQCWYVSDIGFEGKPLAHIKVQRKIKGDLPITSTGFVSRFELNEIFEKYGGAIGFVHTWCDEESKCKNWKDSFSTVQLSLF